MLVSTHFDGGVAGPVQINGNEITFDLRPRQKLLNVLVREVTDPLTLHFLFDSNGASFVIRQGILLSRDGISFQGHSLEQTGNEKWSITVRSISGDLRVATRYPYGRDGLDRLLCDLHGNPRVRPLLMTRDHRSVPLIEWGEDDGSRPIHYILAGEDVGETAGSIVADEAARFLAAGGQIAEQLLAKSMVRIVPVVSLHCAARPNSASHDTLDGQDIYGASKWADETPPPEFALLRQLVEQTILEKRLGLLLCIHSWQAQNEQSQIQFIRTAGENVLTPPRQAAATAVLNQLVDGLPQFVTKIADKCWFPGLARDYLLSRHNVITYRIELTTIGMGAVQFRDRAKRLVENLNAVQSWDFVGPEN